LIAKPAVRRVLAALMMLAALLSPAAPANAQLVPSVLEEVKLVSEDDQRASFMLRFSPREPQYSAVNQNPRRPEVLMRATVRSPRVPERSRHRGVLRQASFENSATGLSMRFDTVLPARVTAEPAGDRAIQVTISRVSEEEALGSRPIGSSGEAVVPATDIPAYVDVNPTDSYELVFLRYADVSEIIGLLVAGQTIQPNNIFIRREPGFGSPASSAQPNYVSAQNQAQQENLPLGQSFPGTGFAVDRRLNAIWLTGPPDFIARAKQQIALIDVPVDSVILETQFVELTEQGARNIGIDLANANGQIAVGGLSINSSNLPFGADANRVYPSGAVQAAIYAQVLKGDGRIVSRPRIAAQSGSTAKIITGDAIPILTNITLSGVNGVSQQVQYVNVGVTLQIAPRVSSDGFVTSQIYGVVSSVTGTSQGYPTISQREAETSASVRDGETFVIGGLTQDNRLTTRSRVPVFGDIPIVGELFKVQRATSSKTELYIVITPHIVRHRRFEQNSTQVSEQPASLPFEIAPTGVAPAPPPPRRN
jgi:general secretion pathway protein D